MPNHPLAGGRGNSPPTTAPHLPSALPGEFLERVNVQCARVVVRGIVECSASVRSRPAEARLPVLKHSLTRAQVALGPVAWQSRVIEVFNGLAGTVQSRSIHNRHERPCQCCACDETRAAEQLPSGDVPTALESAHMVRPSHYCAASGNSGRPRRWRGLNVFASLIRSSSNGTISGVARNRPIFPRDSGSRNLA